MAALKQVKTECRSFLSKLKDFNRWSAGLDGELIEILSQLTLAIDDYYAQNNMIDGDQHKSNAPPLSTPLTTESPRASASAATNVIAREQPARDSPIEVHTPKSSTVIGVNGNQMPSNKAVEPSTDDTPANSETFDSLKLRLNDVLKSLKSAAIAHTTPMDNESNAIAMVSTSQEGMANVQLVASSVATVKVDAAIKGDMERIWKNVAEMFPHAKLYLYGSHKYQLADDCSDINIFLDLEDGYYKIRRKELIEARGIDLDKIFRGHPDKWKNVICTFRNDLYHIIQTVDAKSTIKCTFSFVNGVFVEKSKRLTELMQALPILRECVDYLKKWQSNRKDFRFSSYQLTILVLWYFEYRQYLPSIAQLQSGNSRIECGDIQVNFNQPIVLLQPVMDGVQQLAADFFEIFGRQYVPARDVICPHFGKLFRRNIDPNDQTFDSQNIKLVKMIENTKSICWNPPTAYMYVHDMFLHKNYAPNITSNITRAELNAFQMQCKVTAAAMKPDQS